MDFATLKNKVASYLNRDDLTTQIPDFINVAQRKIERGDPIEAGGVVINPSGNYKCMKATQTGTFVSGSAYLALPALYKEVDAFWLIDSNDRTQLGKTSMSQAMGLYNDLTDTSKPVIFATDTANSRFILRPTPDSAYSYQLDYYKYLAELSGDTDTNWWTINAWEILLYGALLQSQPFILTDDRIAVWAGMLKNALDGLATAENKEVFSGSHQSISGNVIV